MKALKCGALVLGLLAGACNGSPAPESGEEAEVGRIRVALSTPGPTHDVSAINIRVVNAYDSCYYGEAVAEATVPLEEEALPADLSPSGGENHPFADALFVLPPGDYWVCAAPEAEPGVPSSYCTTAEGYVSVFGGATVETTLVSHCTGQPNGGLDVIAALNSPPQITDLDIAESKFITTCEEATITVSASDPDGDEVSYFWYQVSGPAYAALSPSGATATFSTAVAGNYELGVIAYDPWGYGTSLNFPIHVSQEEDCDGGGGGGGGGGEVCRTGEDVGTGSPWVVCAADEDTAWVSANAEGYFHLDLICQELGYAAAGAIGGTCGNVCGYCEDPTSCDSPGQRFFDGGGECGTDELGRLICFTVQWECVN
ncbi:hypothetical protein WME76_01535 [Sorangium sp. So ce119]|uniref:hypothetical protein n=1 Tax=Sorangium sp. So ce119 TaxID=3133279 RepID=UPI003F60C063